MAVPVHREQPCCNTAMYLPDKCLSRGTATLICCYAHICLCDPLERPAQQAHGPHLGTQVDPAEASEKIPFGVSEFQGRWRKGGGDQMLEAVAKMATNQKTVQSDVAE